MTHANFLLFAILLDLCEFDLLQTNELLQLALLAVDLLITVCNRFTKPSDDECSHGEDE